MNDKIDIKRYKECLDEKEKEKFKFKVLAERIRIVKQELEYITDILNNLLERLEGDV